MRVLYLIFSFFFASYSFGQKKYTIVYQNDSHQHFIKHPKTDFKDSIHAVQYLKNLRTTAISKGFILASIDKIAFSQSKATVDLFIGEKFKSTTLVMAAEEMVFVKKHIRISEKLIANIAFTPKEVKSTLSKIHKTYLDNGYPFASIQLSKQEIIADYLHAEIVIIRGPLNKWKKIHVRGDSSISVKYISNLLDIHAGNRYNESQLKLISGRIIQIPFIEEIKPHELLFTKDGTELFLYLKSIPISSMNGIVGFQPDPTTKNLSLTGELNLKLLNTLNRGELLDIKWQSIRDQTQSLTSRINTPFLFNTSFGIDGSFDLYKRDTSFLELNSTIGVQYFLSHGSFIKAYYQNLSSSVLSGGQNNPSFSNLGNVRSNNYGLSYISKRVDYLPNPSKGINIILTTSTGNRRARVNDTLPEAKTVTFRGSVDLEFFIPLIKRHVLRFANLTEYYSAEDIFENEVYRFGGQSSQRGFNEDELFATSRNTTTFEYRFLLDKNSHVFAFADQTWYENNAGNYYKDTPLGFGVGFSFSTNLGVFSISYALGKQQGNPILLSNGKIHFGYIAYF